MELFGIYNVKRSPENESNIPVSLKKKKLDPIVRRQKWMW